MRAKGFTLIELLVVIAIIGILSSVVISSLSTARNKAKDIAVKENVRQFAALMEFNRDEYGGYCELRAAWIPSTTCAASFSGNYATKARAICEEIVKNTGPGTTKLYMYPVPDCKDNYTFMALLNNGKWYCQGSSGAKGEYPAYNQPGCYQNP